ncbi:MAG: phosphoribosyltransferase family protein [Gammaproteobacteria bacterium]|nr:phosphoribosyltransferase family protein [Gammaproteobacteria bacterium]
MVNKYLEWLLDQLAPCSCQLCGQATGRPVALCEPCQRSLACNSSACPNCALPSAEAGELPCGHCQQQPPAFASTTAPYLYTQPVDGFIKQLKFSADLCQLPVLAELMSRPMAQALRRHGRPDLLVPVPLHWRRQWRRGFNQASLLARQLRHHPLLRDWSLQVDDRLCTRRRATVAQHGLAPEQRRHNIRQAFSCREYVSDLHVVIVDDVMTTGATVEALAREILNQGARRVDVWCCARTPAPTDSIPSGQCKPSAVTPY